MNSFLKSLLALSSILLLSNVQAHQTWLEASGDTSKFYFGEFHKNLLEASPGSLDKFKGNSALLISANGHEKKLNMQKQKDHFVISQVPAKGESIIVEEKNYAITAREKKGKTSRRYFIPAARLLGDLSAQTAKMTLDIVPTGKVNDGRLEMQATYMGKPLSKSKVSITIPAGWKMATRTDKNGLFSISMPWQGMYVVKAVKRNQTSGTRKDGETYDSMIYSTSVTLMQNKGLQALPAPTVIIREKKS